MRWRRYSVGATASARRDERAVPAARVALRKQAGVGTGDALRGCDPWRRVGGPRATRRLRALARFRRPRGRAFRDRNGRRQPSGQQEHAPSRDTDGNRGTPALDLLIQDVVMTTARQETVDEGIDTAKAKGLHSTV